MSKFCQIFLFCIFLASCAKVSREDDRFGRVAFKLENDYSFTTIVKSSEVSSPLILNFYSTDGSLVKRVDDHRLISDSNPLSMRMGYYDLEIMDKEFGDFRFNEDLYGKTDRIAVRPDILNTYSYVIKMLSTRFSAEFDDNFDSRFTQYSVKVSNGISEVVLSSNPDTTKANEDSLSSYVAFAKADSLILSVDATNTDGGRYSYTKTYFNVKPAQSYIVKISIMKDEENFDMADVRIVIDSTVIEASLDILLDFNNKKLPTWSPSSAFDTKTMAYTMGNDNEKILSFSVPEGIKNLFLICRDQKLLQMGMPSNLDLVEAGAADIERLQSLGITTQSISTGASQARFDFTSFIKDLYLGNYAMKLIAFDSRDHFCTFDFNFEITADTYTEVGEVIPWSCFAYFTGTYITKELPSGAKFQYRKTTDGFWTDANASRMVVNSDTKTVKLCQSSLDPNSDYIVRFVNDEDLAGGKDFGEIEFRTSGVQTIPNLNFDSWYLDGKSWMPNENSSSNTWDSANPGTADYGYVPTTPESTVVVKGKAARLETMMASVFGLQKLAAGNIYTGKFGKVVVTSAGAELDWGIPFSERPIALRGWVRYSPKTIDNANSPYDNMKGKTDQCQVQIFITDWTSPFRVSTGAQRFVDTQNDKGIIAYGSFETNENMSSYKQVTIPLVYRDTTRLPSYVVMSAAASRYGDYFTGAKGSVLLLDEFELIYDPKQLSDEDFAKVFQNFN